jgi:hypothetical protein
MATRKATAKNSPKQPTKQTTQKSVQRTSRAHAGKPSTTPPARRWSAKVTTDSTHPGHDLFNQDAATIAKSLASRKVSPKGPASGMRMLNFYINRAGKNLSAERHNELEKAKEILSGIIAKQKGKPPANRSGDRKSAAKKLATKKSATKKKPTQAKS